MNFLKNVFSKKLLPLFILNYFPHMIIIKKKSFFFLFKHDLFTIKLHTSAIFII